MKPPTLPSMALVLARLALSVPVPMGENALAAVQRVMLQTFTSEINSAGTRLNNNDKDESGFDNRPYTPSETESVSQVLSLSRPIQTSYLMSLVDAGDGGMARDVNKAEDILPATIILSATASAVANQQDEVTEVGMEYPTQKATVAMQDGNGSNTAVLLLIFIIAVILIEKMEEIMKSSNIVSFAEGQVHLGDEKLAKGSTKPISINAN